MAMLLATAGSLGLLTANASGIMDGATAAVGFAALLLMVAPLLLFSAAD